MLAHAYLRDDHVLDDVLPPEIPIPPIAEVQRGAATAPPRSVTGETGEALKRRLRTGTVVTTDDRNWELRYHGDGDGSGRQQQRQQLADGTGPK